MPPRDEFFVRRIAALVVAQSAATAHAEPDAVTRAIAIMRAAGGDADGLDATGIVAGFDHPSAAVEAANRLHAATAEALGWCVGIHVGEVMMTAEGVETRTAIERAIALARCARPGTSAIPADALAALGAIRDVTIEATDVSPPGDGAVQLIVPRTRAPSVARRRLVAGLGAAVLGGAAVVAWVDRRPPTNDVGPPLVTLGVGPFRSSKVDPEHAWIGDALRTSLNTQLSELSGVKVYSREFLDFVMRHDQLSEIEVANRLGIQKMLSGTVLVVGGAVRVEAQIIDVPSGLLEGAYATVGQEEAFLTLENDVVLGVIARLRVPLSPEDERRLAARRAVNPEAFRRFLDTEGAHGAPAPTPPESGQPEGFLRFLGARAAYAEDARTAVAALVEAYRRALEAHDVSALADMYVRFVDEQRLFLERYFAAVRDLEVRIEDMDIAVSGEEAVVSYTRVDDFIDIPTGRPQHLSLRVTRTLKRVNDHWHFAAAQ